MKQEDILKNRFTEKGLKDLKAKLNTSIKFFNSEETVYPISEILLGFGKWNIEDRNELLGRIIELAEITFTPIKINKIKHDNGEIKMEIII